MSPTWYVGGLSTHITALCTTLWSPVAQSTWTQVPGVPAWQVSITKTAHCCTQHEQAARLYHSVPPWLLLLLLLVMPRQHLGVARARLVQAAAHVVLMSGTRDLQLYAKQCSRQAV